MSGNAVRNERPATGKTRGGFRLADRLAGTATPNPPYEVGRPGSSRFRRTWSQVGSGGLSRKPCRKIRTLCGFLRPSCLRHVSC